MNIKLAIRVENLIVLDMFWKEGVIFHHFLQLFTLKKSTLNNAIIWTVNPCSAQLYKVHVYQTRKWLFSELWSTQIKKKTRFEKNALKVSKTERGKCVGAVP